MEVLRLNSSLEEEKERAERFNAELTKEQDKIDLVILDLIMPGMGGRRCLEALLQINPGARVVVSSGYPENGPMGEARTAGSMGFISKPYDMRQILSVVRQVLTQH